MAAELPDPWPLRQHSRFLESAGMTWHVQELGDGPCLLLLHGTGASTHSWAPLALQLAEHFRLIIPDLPGQGFSEGLPADQTHLEGFATRLHRLLEDLHAEPVGCVGHSAGAAILVRMALDGWLNIGPIISINGAFLPFGTVAAPIFSKAAEWLAQSRPLAWITAAHGFFERPIRNLLSETGSAPNDEMVYCYKTLLKNPEHVAGTLRMMAGWDLERLRQDLPGLERPLHLVVCEGDKTVSPWQAERLSELVSTSRLHRITRLGHIGHEEFPDPFTNIIRRALSEH